MATTSRTMAEVIASSLSSSNNNTNATSSEVANTGSPVVDSKDENESITMIKTFPHLTITVYIPTACVGVLIGKRGSNIDSIQKLAAKESTMLQAGGSPLSSSSRGARNKAVKQMKSGSSMINGNQKAVSSESVRISVVNYPPPTANAQHQQNYEHYKSPQKLGGETGINSPAGHEQQQQMATAMIEMGVPPTYTELDFSDPQWTPIVVRADPVAAIYAAKAIYDICYPEYVNDRTQLVYIMDVPVPAVASGNSNNANLRHASIVGKRGNKLIQLSAENNCRIMVPPKQLGHNIIQLEAPLKECCSCLKAILAKLQAGSTSGNEEKEHGDTTKTSPNMANKNARNNGNGKMKKDTPKNSCQMTLIIHPLPSQTKLRNIARKTETKILKKRIPKWQRNQKQNQEPKTDPELKPLGQSFDEGEAGEQQQEKQDQGNSNNNNIDTKVLWRLTVVATSEKKVLKAVDMLKVLNSKGYEVIVEEGTKNADTSTKTVSEGSMGAFEDDADGGVSAWGSDSQIDGGPIDGLKSVAASTPTSNGNSGRNGGRGNRFKKQRYRNNNRGNNGKDNTNMSSGKQQHTSATNDNNSSW